MALVKCSECGKDVSTIAKACPSCGAKRQKNVGPGGIIFALVIGMLVYQCTLGTSGRNRADVASTALPKAQEEISRRSATGACMEFIKQRLHDPSSAQFGNSGAAEVSIKGRRAVVVRQVRAKNAFNAMRLSEFVCLVELKGDMVMPVLVEEKSKNSKELAETIKKWGM